MILLGSVISHGDMLRLIKIKPIAEASGNVILTECVNGVILAVETQNTEGYIAVNGEYTELLSDKKLNKKIQIKPYEILVLKR